jgi:hypothetical protein
MTIGQAEGPNGSMLETDSVCFPQNFTLPRGISVPNDPAFQLATDNPNPHGSTPQRALSAFLAHGSVFGAAPPILRPAKAGYPASGWHEIRAESNMVIFQSGRAQLDFTRTTSGWVITSGAKVC